MRRPGQSRLLSLDFDVLLAIACLLGAGGLIIYSLVLIDRVVYTAFGAILIITAGSWFLLRRVDTSKVNRLRENRSAGYALAAVFFSALTVLVLIYQFRPDPYSRPLVFFVLASIMAGTVAMEAMIIPIRRGLFLLVLTQVLIIALVVPLSQVFLFPDVINVDPAIHQSLVKGLIINGFTTKGFDYSTTPLFHIAVASMVRWPPSSSGSRMKDWREGIA